VTTTTRPGARPAPAPRSPAGAHASFPRVERDAGVLVVREDLLETVCALGLPAAEAARALLATAPAGQGRSRTAVVDLPGDAGRLHLRPVLHGGWLAPLWRGRLLGLARPIAELHATEMLRSRGAPVPEAVLVAGWRAAPLWAALFGTLQIAGARDGLAWLRGKPSAAALDAAAVSAGHAVRRFHDAGGRHADLHVKNLLLRGDPDRPETFVIDLDKAQVGAPPTPRRRMQELMRLYRSLIKRGVFEEIGPGPRTRFFASYTDGDASLASALLAHYPRELRRVSRHARGYSGSR